MTDNMAEEAIMTEEKEEDSTVDCIVPRVMGNDVILARIFKFIEFDSLKVCRLVSKKWNSLVEPCYRRRATVIRRGEGETKDMKDLVDLVTQNDYPPFTSVALCGVWKPAELSKFLATEGKDLIELHLRNVELPPVVVNAEAVAPFILPKMTKLKKLEIVDDQRNARRISAPVTVPWSSIQSVENLYVFGGTLNLERYCHISPKLLTITGYPNMFLDGILHSRTQSPRVLINDFVKFESLTELILMHNDFAVDLRSPAAALDVLELGPMIQAINWDKCQWKVDDMKLYNVLMQTNLMSVNKLELMCLSSLWTIDLSDIPETVGTLILGDFKVSCRQTLHLPLLKYLILERRSDVKLLTYFRNLQNLQELQIANASFKAKVNVEHLPIGLRRLLIHGYCGVTGPDTAPPFRLDTLMMVRFYRNDFRKWDFSKINAQDLVYTKVGSYEVLNDIFMEEVLTISKKYCGTVTVGEFGLADNCSFEKSFLRKFVDKESGFYTFRSGKGIASTSETVEEHRNLFVNRDYIE